jgi:hypothetical protein
MVLGMGSDGRAVGNGSAEEDKIGGERGAKGNRRRKGWHKTNKG